MDDVVIWREVVGVAGHVKNYGIDQESRIELYLPVLRHACWIRLGYLRAR